MDLLFEYLTIDVCDTVATLTRLLAQLHRSRALTLPTLPCKRQVSIVRIQACSHPLGMLT